MKRLTEIEFQNQFTDSFAGDNSGQNFPRQTPGVLYSTVHPTPVSAPRLLAWSEPLARELGIARPANQEEIDILGGNLVVESMNPYAACYAGHQFGNWAGQLGDGRAITLGEMMSDGHSWELQLKGPGPTPYSRRADGRAVLRSSLREYLMSEAMYHLRVPTTRALSLVATGDRVMRDMFYDGHPEFEPGAIVLRVAPSFLRFGSFEMLAARRETENLSKLITWTIDRYYPHITGTDRELQWLSEVVKRTAHLMSEWMRVGFVHGVMNTDNMSILGLTIDYGPYSFLDDYDPNFTPNTTDLPGRRYAFGRQAAIAKWNLGCLAGAISLVHSDEEALVKILDEYDEQFSAAYFQMMSHKLGIEKVDLDLIGEWEKSLIALKADMTIFYQLLIDLPARELTSDEIMEHFEPSLYNKPSKKVADSFEQTVRRYKQVFNSNERPRESSVEIMRKANPRFILRNYLLAQAIEDLENGNSSLFEKLQQAILDPYSRNFDEFFQKRPDWAVSKAGCSMLSCSS